MIFVWLRITYSLQPHLWCVTAFLDNSGWDGFEATLNLLTTLDESAVHSHRDGKEVSSALRNHNRKRWPCGNQETSKWFANDKRWNNLKLRCLTAKYLQVKKSATDTFVSISCNLWGPWIVLYCRQGVLCRHNRWFRQNL